MREVVLSATSVVEHVDEHRTAGTPHPGEDLPVAATTAAAASAPAAAPAARAATSAVMVVVMIVPLALPALLPALLAVTHDRIVAP